MLSKYEADYCQLIAKIITEGSIKQTRNGETFSLFGEVLKIDSLEFGHFPLLLGRRIFYSGVLGELAAFLRGPSCIEDFKKFGCNYWDSWGDAEGKINVDYGNAWLDYNGVNQLENILNTLKTNPNDRRMVIDSWRPDHLDKLSLPCCHFLYQWRVNPIGNTLDMVMYMRSVDVMIGLPSDVVLAAALNILIAKEVKLNPGTITMMFGDTHIYDNHYEPTKKYLENCESLATSSVDPKVSYAFTKPKSVVDFLPDNLEITRYHPMSKINFELNV